MRVVIHIDRLVLRGVRPEDRHAFADALQAELRHHLAAPDAARGLAQRRDVTDIEAGRISVASKAGPARAGAAIARSIAKELGQ